MRKHFGFLTFFKCLIGLSFLALLIMIYWSSLLVEEGLRKVQHQVLEIKEDVNEMRQTSRFYPESQEKKQKDTVGLNYHSREDSSLPNLLEVDPFYIDTLPKLLGPNFKIQGTLHSASIGKPDNLHPFSPWSEVGEWTSQCSLSVARLLFGRFETLSPNMARKMEERKNESTGKTEFWIFLREGVFWQPLHSEMFGGSIKLAPQFLKKHLVTAHDFKFYYDIVMNPNVQEPGAVAFRNYISDIESFEVVDDYTFVVTWKHEIVKDEEGKESFKPKYVAKLWTGISLRPFPRFVYQYFSNGLKILENDTDPDVYRTSSLWAQNFSHHWANNVIVSCGPWIFESITDRRIRFRRNPHHFFLKDVLVDAMDVEFKNTGEAVWQEFKSNHLDSYALQPNQLPEYKEFLMSPQYKEQVNQASAIHELEYLGRGNRYIGWNMANPLFKNKKVRQALTMAIDRKRIIDEILNEKGIEITGPFYPKSEAYDSSIEPWPFDLYAAKQFLEEEGWYDSDGDGIIDKIIEGKRVPFQFKITYFVKNSITKTICEYVATALKAINIKCELNGVDVADLSSSIDDKSFEALCLGWTFGMPPEDPKQLWHSSGAKEKGSSNLVGFANPIVDEIIERLQFESNLEKRIRLYHQFHEIIHEEQPYTFLFVPKVIFLYRDYLQNVFIPSERQDLVPKANISEPESSIFWLRPR